jgi:hypothetical protein
MTLSVDETLAHALGLARRRADVARVWPVLFAKNKARLNLAGLERMARSLGQERALGFFVSLLLEFMHDSGLASLERRLALGSGPPREMEYFFLTPCGERLLNLERARTPDVARKWLFWMNATTGWFWGCFLKHGAGRASV